MGLALAHPAALAALAFPAAAVLAARLMPPPLSRFRARLALGVRLAMLLALVLALSGLAVTSPPRGQTLVVLADRSASVTAAADQERQAVTALIAALRGEDRLGVVSFGRDPVVEAPPDHQPAFSDFSGTPNVNYTNVENALRLGASLLPPDQRRHLLLVSDGRQNIGDALAEARLLRGQGTRVDVLPLKLDQGPEVYVDSLRVPAAVPPGARPHALTVLESNVATFGRLVVSVDGRQVHDAPLSLPVGETQVDVVLPALGPGFHDVHAEIDPAQDTFAENNVGEGLIEVLGPQQVLVVEGGPGEAANLAAALRAASLSPRVVAPAQVPAAAADLAQYQAVALVDVPATALVADQMLALQAGVRDLGIGLAAFGGPDTFGPGGFAGTPLEAALPIDMQIADRSQKPPVAVVLVLETMEDASADAVMRAAAKAVVAHLTARDLVGVTDSNTGLVVPLQPVADQKKIDAAIDGIQSFGDAMSYGPFIQTAGDALAAHADTTRHIIVLGDGDTGGDYGSLLQGLTARGITTSAIGIDVHHSPQMMAEMAAIARDGKGRFYQSESPGQVPDLLLQETQKGLKPWIVEERFRPSLDAPSPTLAGIDLTAFPALTGYVASTPKAAAEVVLRSAKHDPVLAQWQYGLGRSTAWTSDTSGRWTAELLGWNQSGRLLANIVASTLPLGADPALALQAQTSGDTGHLIAQLAGAPADATAVANVVAPDLTTTSVPLQPTGAGRFEGDFTADQVGAYVAHVEVRGNGGRAVHAGTAGLAVAYSPEFRALGTNLGLLRQLAAAGGGVVLTDPAAAFAQPLPDLQVSHSLAFLLLALAALLLPLDVACRRLVFRRTDADLWRALPRRRELAAAPVEETVGRLRGRVAARRGRQGGPPATTPGGDGRAAAADREVPPSGAPGAGSEEEGSALAEPGDLAARLLARRRRGKGGGSA
ncbi:MAG TPA: VWA domain-containing protein [Candidatus Dormibacteraeota bacterium]|jgi:hypothetical protein|nr:VWA domain-containing protein [Candidatus Dormibacteraeota bacterium]